MKESDNVPTNLYNHFHTSLSENSKLYHKIPTYQEEEEQTGSSVNNNIIINDKDLNNGILTLSLRQSGAVSKKIFDCFFLVYWVHLNVIYQILNGWFIRCLETSMYHT